MNLDHAQLAALVAVIREGSFDAAAQVLHVTPSAISQRIKQLEERVGGILVVRGAPCGPTQIGEVLYRHGLQIELLEKDLRRSIVPLAGPRTQSSTPISVAANADSLATWLVPALAQFAAETGLNVEVVVDDQDHTAGWLRSGRVLGAVTAEAVAVQGCRVQPLGVMRYRATASSRFIKRWFAAGVDAKTANQAPLLIFNRKDLLHERFMRQALGRIVRPIRTHLLPSPTALAEATAAGMGWGMNPEHLVRAHLAGRRLQDLMPHRSLDVPLYWQQWGLASYSLDALASALKAHASKTLRA